MKKKILTIGIIIIIVMIATINLVNAASSVSFQEFEGNYDDPKKIDPPVDITIYFDSDGNRSATPTNRYIIFDVSDDGIYLSFKATGILVTQIYLKGGEHYGIYTFTPGVTEASGLVCPDNNGGNTPMISHYGLIEVSVPTETTTTTTGTTGTTATTTTTTGTTTTGTTTTGTTTSTTTTGTTTTGTTTTGTTTTQLTTSTSTSTPTTTSTDDLPKTGESDNFTGTVIGLSLIFLAGALYFLLHKKPQKT